MREIDTSQPCVCGGRGMTEIDQAKRDRNVTEDIRVICTRCGRKTKNFTMPWIAWEAWDRHEYIDGGQMTIFDVIGGEA